MIIPPDSSEFDDLFRLLFTSLGNLEPKKFYSCVITSSILASWFMRFSDDITIINAGEHSVVYDGYSTWDISLGIVFDNYKYPNSAIPKYTKIPLFYRFFWQGNFNRYYNKEALEKASISVSEIVLSHRSNNGTT